MTQINIQLYQCLSERSYKDKTNYSGSQTKVTHSYI